MIPATNHLNDDDLSALIDHQLDAAFATAARAHLQACAACAARLAELEAVVGMLRQLPEVELPRDFSIGPRVIADPPNVIRLQRFYTWTRAASASLAAVFVLLVAGAVYVDTTAPRSRAAVTTAFAPPPKAAPALSASPQAGGVSALSAAAPTPEPAAARDASKAGAAAPAAPAARAPAAQAPAPAAANAPGVAPAPHAEDAVATAAESQETAEQTAAATSVRALPTPAPTEVPQTLAVPRGADGDDPAAPWRIAAATLGVLAALTLLATFVVRHRLRRAHTSIPLIPQE